MTRPLVIALDGDQPITNPTAATLLRLAYQAHRVECGACAQPAQPCAAARALLSTIRPADLLPGYTTDLAYPAI